MNKLQMTPVQSSFPYCFASSGPHLFMTLKLNPEIIYLWDNLSSLFPEKLTLRIMSLWTEFHSSIYHNISWCHLSNLQAFYEDFSEEAGCAESMKNWWLEVSMVENLSRSVSWSWVNGQKYGKPSAWPTWLHILYVLSNYSWSTCSWFRCGCLTSSKACILQWQRDSLLSTREDRDISKCIFLEWQDKVISASQVMLRLLSRWDSDSISENYHLVWR